MTPDSNGPMDAEPAANQAGGEPSDAVRAAATETGAQLESATAAVADEAQAANQQGAKLASEASRVTADAFGEARERLNAMASALPNAPTDVLKPFGAAGDAYGKGLQASYASALEGMAEFNSKAIAAWRSNAESTIRHWQSLAGIKSLSEAIALSAEHTRQQLEAMTAQTRELSGLASRIVRGAADPLNRNGR